MIVIVSPDVTENSDTYQSLIKYLSQLPKVQIKVHQVTGTEQTLTEIYLLGSTASLDAAEIAAQPGVERVVRVSQEYRVIGRHLDDHRPAGFEYNGIKFNQNNLNIFAGLCAVSTAKHVETMMQALQQHGQHCTRMGAYKPRTNPYAFQGHGKNCLPYVFELAGKYGIKVIAMEITHESHIVEITQALEATGHPTGVMLQIGTRNTQNFELLKSVGRQTEFPILIKRGFGITLNESLNATEYLASEGNSKIVFCLRGMKTNMGDPHRNLVDFAHVPVVKRLTRLPVCIDPSHSVGTLVESIDGISDVFHATAQGLIAGANMVLVDFHPEPAAALVDGAQALTLEQLPWFLEDCQIAWEAYEQRVKIAKSRT